MLAGFTRLVRLDFLAILAPNLAFVIFSLFLLVMSGAAVHCPRSATILPFLGPMVHLNLRTTLDPLLAQAMLSLSAGSISSRSRIIILTASAQLQ